MLARRGLPDRMRRLTAAFTTRGRSFVAAGIAAGLCAVLFAQRDLLRIAVLLVALPVGCAVVLSLDRYRLGLTRTISPPRVQAGSPAQVRLELENLTRLRTRVLLAADHLPQALGHPPHFVLSRLPPGQRAAVTYTVRPPTRGRYPIGPLHLRLADPFGMCELDRSFTATDPLTVVPKTWPLAGVPAGGRWSGDGESPSRRAAAGGEDDVAIREYRHGDDLRRVHWRSTAHRGELMVKRDEQPRQLRATVLLDARAQAHRGEGPASSFEWAVSAAASAAIALSEQRFAVRVLLDEQPAWWTSPSHADGPGAFLERFALVEPAGQQSLAAATTTLAQAGGDGVLVAVLGELDPAAAHALAGLGRGASRIALLLRTPQWAGLAPRLAADLDAERARAAALLRSEGWSVAEASQQQNPAQVWAQAVTALLPERGAR